MKKKLLILFLCLGISIPSQVHAECEHQWSDWMIQEPTCNEEGYECRYCELCSEEERTTIPPTNNHKWDSWYISKEPDCYQNGMKKRYCDVCNRVEYAEIPAYGSHDWSEWNVWEPSTCGYNGLEYRACKRCHDQQTRLLPKSTFHELGSWWTSEKPTALHAGTRERVCECGKRCEEKKIPKLKAKVTLNKKYITIRQKKSYTLKIKSKTYGDKIKKWVSHNKKIAVVSTKGKVTGKKKGTTTITLTMKSGAKVSCKVRVK